MLGLNGHVVVQAVETPLTDYAAVTERIAKVARRRLAMPHGRGPGVRLLGLRRRPARSCAASAPRIWRGCPAIAAQYHARLARRASTRAAASLVGAASPSTWACALGDKITLIAPAGAPTAFGITPRMKT